jgi:hypothetical protein
MLDGVAEAKKKQPTTNPRPTLPAPHPLVVVETCPLFDQTFSRHIVDNDQLRRKLDEFIAFKKNTPLARFGGSDKGDTGVIFDREVPGIKHAHLTFDLSIWYTLTGSNPKSLRLYAIMSHDESGTGQPVKVPVMKNVAKRMAGQTRMFKPATKIT